MKSIEIRHKIALLFYLTASSLFYNPIAAKSQYYDGLHQLSNSQTLTYYSEGAQEQARIMAQRCANVISFYKPIIDFEPKVTLLVLGKEDWSNYTDFPVYGMPHYKDDRTLVVASEDNDFWRSFIPPLDQLPEELARLIAKTYVNPDSTLSMRDFFDLLAIHELGHAFHVQAGMNMQRMWLAELFVNTFLHTYIAENEPHLLPALTVFPQMVVTSTDVNDLAFTSLNDIETKYEIIGQQYPQNYGWYQCRWHKAAGTIHDQGGLDVFERFWSAFKDQTTHLNDHELPRFLSENIHQSVADVLLNWADEATEP